MLMIVVFHQVSSVVKFFLKLRPLVAVFVQRSAVDQILQLAGVVFEQERFVNEILIVRYE